MIDASKKKAVATFNLVAKLMLLITVISLCIYKIVKASKMTNEKQKQFDYARYGMALTFFVFYTMAVYSLDESNNMLSSFMVYVPVVLLIYFISSHSLRKY